MTMDCASSVRHAHNTQGAWKQDTMHRHQAGNNQQGSRTGLWSVSTYMQACVSYGVMLHMDAKHRQRTGSMRPHATCEAGLAF